MSDDWLTFDCYGTLIDWESGLAAAYGEALGLDRERALARHHEVEPRLQAADPQIPYREVLRQCLLEVAELEGLTAPDGEQALGDSLPFWPAFPEVPGELRRARDAGWRLAILSNTDPDFLAASLRVIGVQPDLEIVASEIGSYKPGPGHWRAFRERAGEVGRHVHVAASLFHDIAPCAELGIPSVWINRLGETSNLPRGGELPDLTGLAEAVEAAAG